MYTETLLEHLITDNYGLVLVSIVERQMKNGRLVLYGRFKIAKRELAKGQRFIVRSLRTDNLEIARRRAHEIYAALKYKQESDVHLTVVNVNECITRFIINYEENLRLRVNGFSQHMLRGYKKNIDIYWREYIGENDISTVLESHLSGYEIWRQEWAKNTKRKRSNDQRYKETISRRTIQWEVNAFKAFLKWCARNNYYNGKAYEWRYSVGVKNRRSAFTREQYHKLRRYISSPEFFNKGKHKNDMRIQRHRMMLRTYITFLAKTGLRVGEVRNLRWSDISEAMNKQGKKVVVIRVSEKHSKINKSRSEFDFIVGRSTALVALKQWKAYLKKGLHHALHEDIVWKDEADNHDLIFCNENGKPIGDFREGYNSVIREAGVEFDANGNKHVIYSLRHTFITFQIKYIKNLSIHRLARNCRTSVSMIEQFYSDAIPEDFINEITG